jgi:MFS family permease
MRRVETADLFFVTAKWGTRVAILVYAFDRGGVAETGFVAVIQFVPSAVIAPLGSVLGDEIRRERALLAGYALQATAVGGTAAAMLAGAPATAVYALTVVVAASMTLTRPVLSALLPQLARSPDELIAVNVVTESIRGGMALVGPAIAGVLLGLGEEGLAMAAFAGLLLLAVLLVIGLEPHRPAERIQGHSPREVVAGFRSVAREPDQRLVVGLLVGQSVIRGALDVLLVVITLELSGLPASVVGYLGAARGLGGLTGGLWALRLVGKPRLAAALAFGMLIYGFGTGSLAFAMGAVMAAVILVVTGLGHARSDLAGRTLLQRVVPDRILCRVFGVMEGLTGSGRGGHPGADPGDGPRDSGRDPGHRAAAASGDPRPAAPDPRLGPGDPDPRSRDLDPHLDRPVRPAARPRPGGDRRTSGAGRGRARQGHRARGRGGQPFLRRGRRRGGGRPSQPRRWPRSGPGTTSGTSPCFATSPARRR